MDALRLLFILNFSVLGLGYVLGSLVGLFVLIAICLLALLGLVMITPESESH